MFFSFLYNYLAYGWAISKQNLRRLRNNKFSFFRTTCLQVYDACATAPLGVGWVIFVEESDAYEITSLGDVLFDFLFATIYCQYPHYIPKYKEGMGNFKATFETTLAFMFSPLQHLAAI